MAFRQQVGMEPTRSGQVLFQAWNRDKRTLGDVEHGRQHKTNICILLRYPVTLALMEFLQTFKRC